MSCPPPDQLDALIRGSIPEPDKAVLQPHVEGCGTCSAYLSLKQPNADPETSLSADSQRTEPGRFVSRVDAAPRPPARMRALASDSSDGGDGPPSPEEKKPEPLARGVQVGRYVIVSLLGKGGMGEVYVAYDPELDRKVAVKVLQTGSAGTASSREQKQLRLLREAQAMARLSHPNVVAVYDVGTFGSRVFMAMELVDGTTLRRWVKETPRSRRQVVDALVAAGRGLSAAHAAGIIHRDFKPDNVLVGRDGSVKVTDFGLARANTGAEDKSDSQSDEHDWDEPPGSRESNPLSAPLTRAGTLVGTPSYIAPEQYRGVPADTRTDQFGFCVTLYEALQGKRPYDPATLRGMGLSVDPRELADDAPTRPQRKVRSTRATPSKVDNEVAPPPANLKGVPTWLHRHILRGLAPDPADRFDSMASLLEALSHDPAVPRRRMALGAAAVVLTGAVAFATIQVSQAACSGGPDRFAGVWSPARRAVIREAFIKAGAPDPEGAFVRVEKELGRYAQGWTRMYGDACQAHRRGEQTAEALGLRMGCLDRRLKGVDALAGIFEKADAEVVSRSAEAVAALHGVSGCANLEALMAPVPVPEDLATQQKVGELRDRIARAKAELDAGRYKEAMPIAEKVVEEARQIAYRPVQAESQLILGMLRHKSGDPKGAEGTYSDALNSAAAGGDDEVAIQAAIELVTITGLEQHRYEGARFWARQASGWLEKLGGNDELEARLANSRGNLLFGEGRFGDALVEYQRAIQLSEKAFGPDHLRTAGSLGNLGLVLTEQRRFGEAAAAYERTLAIQQSQLGRLHPKVAKTYSVAASASLAEGKLEVALTGFTQALEISKKTIGIDHPDSWGLLANLGRVHEARGEVAQAKASHRQAAELAERTMGGDHSLVATHLLELAGLHEREGELKEALGLYQRVHRIFRAEIGEKDAKATDAAESIARMEIRLGRADSALRSLERLLVIEEEVMGRDHPFLASCLRLIGEAHLALEKPGRALPFLERSLALLEPLQLNDEVLAPSRFALARALWTANRDSDRATELAQKARAGFAAMGRTGRLEQAEADRWLATRGIAVR